MSFFPVPYAIHRGAPQQPLAYPCNAPVLQPAFVAFQDTARAYTSAPSRLVACRTIHADGTVTEHPIDQATGQADITRGEKTRATRDLNTLPKVMIPGMRALQIPEEGEVQGRLVSSSTHYPDGRVVQHGGDPVYQPALQPALSRGQLREIRDLTREIHETSRAITTVEHKIHEERSLHEHNKAEINAELARRCQHIAQHARSERHYHQAMERAHHDAYRAHADEHHHHHHRMHHLHHKHHHAKHAHYVAQQQATSFAPLPQQPVLQPQFQPQPHPQPQLAPLPQAGGGFGQPVGGQQIFHFNSHLDLMPKADPKNANEGVGAVIIGNNDGGLQGCGADAYAMANFFYNQRLGGTNGHLFMLTDKDAKDGTHYANKKNEITAWVNSMIKAAERKKADGNKPVSLVWHNSSHGTHAAAAAGDKSEADGQDEFVVPAGAKSLADMISDNLMAKMVLDHLPQGVPLLALFDNCHAGTNMDLRYGYTNDQEGFTATSEADTAKAIEAKGLMAIAISTSRDTQTSADGGEIAGFPYQVGAGTGAYLSVLKANPNPTLRELVRGMNDCFAKSGQQQRVNLQASVKLNLDEHLFVIGTSGISTINEAIFRAPVHA